MKRCLMLLLPVILLLAGCGHAPQENESLESMTAPMTADHSQWQQEPYYILQFNVDSVISNAPNVTATASRVIISQGGTSPAQRYFAGCPSSPWRSRRGETARLVLCGVDMHCERGPVIYSNGGGTVVLLLENGTENTLSDGKSYLYSGSKVREAAISVEGDLLITGGGSLSVEAIHNDALRSEGTLAVAEGTLEITAWRDGLVAGQELQISGGQLSIACGRTGLSASSAKSGQGSVTLAGGTVALICGGDGITAAGSLSATAGEYHITTGGGSGNASYGETTEKWGLWGGLPQQQPTEEQPIINREQIVSDSARGLSAGKSLALSGGTFTLDCSDAALYSVGSTKLSGSRVTISGGDTAITTQQLTLSAGDVSILTARRGAVAEDMTLSGGSLSITAVEEGLALSGGYVRSENDPATDLRKMTVTGGSLSICAGTHALDIGGSLFQSGGSLLLGSGREQNPLRAATAHISGGTLLAAGPLPEELQLYTSLPRISVELWLTGGRPLTVTAAERVPPCSPSPRKPRSVMLLSSAMPWRKIPPTISSPAAPVSAFPRSERRARHHKTCKTPSINFSTQNTAKIPAFRQGLRFYLTD